MKSRQQVFLAVAVLIFTAAGLKAQNLTPMQQLGKSIFFDTDLSLNKNQSCAACHAPAAGWTGPDSSIK